MVKFRRDRRRQEGYSLLYLTPSPSPSPPSSEVPRLQVHMAHILDDTEVVVDIYLAR